MGHPEALRDYLSRCFLQAIQAVVMSVGRNLRIEIERCHYQMIKNHQGLEPKVWFIIWRKYDWIAHFFSQLTT
jgi:hypothetical protein